MFSYVFLVKIITLVSFTLLFHYVTTSFDKGLQVY